ncbi:MAG: phage tail tape measure protein [Oscillospiraceae bacterium]|nr:phage tail tape measure protein [Oscillospiraceae bacterium]
MPQADGYVRIVTQNDTTDAQRSTEQLGDTIRDSMDTTPVDNMNNSVGGLQDGISDTGEAALKTGDLIKANLVSEAVTQGIQQLGDVLKNAASHTIEVADGLNSSTNKIVAATNASAEEMAKLKSIIQQIYGDNFGESFEDIADSISKIKQNLGELDDKELVNVTESAYALQDVFDYGVDESSRAVKAMMENFNISAAEAYDYIARGAQNGLDYSGELLDNISEYSVQFKKMGLSASDMFTIFENGAENVSYVHI